MDTTMPNRRLLTTWNQIAPRAYIRKCFCFRFEQTAHLGPLKEHLSLALKHLSQQFPHLSGKIHLLSQPKGRLCIDSGGSSEIPLSVFDERTSFDWTYTELKDQDFPAGAFVNRSFDLAYELVEDGEGVPVFEVHARVIQDGLLLCIYGHHSVFDGTGMDNYISFLATLSNHTDSTFEPNFPVDIDIDLPDATLSGPHINEAFEELLRRCSEYCVLPSPSGPTQFRESGGAMPLSKIQRAGQIFTIRAQSISAFKEAINMEASSDSRRQPSTFTCLTAIIWAHCTSARLLTRHKIISSAAEVNPPRTVSRLLLSVNWRRRA